MRQTISFDWRFLPEEELDFSKAYEKGERIDIPHAAKVEPVNCFSEKSYQFISTYTKKITINKKENERLFLDFDAAMATIHLFFNGVDLGTKVSAYVKASFEITSLAKEGENVILAIVDSSENKEIPPFGKAIDYLTFSGIYRPVYLVSHPTTYIENLKVHADMKGHLSIKAEVIGDDNYTITYSLYDGDTLVKEFEETEIDIEDVHLWSDVDPHLYTLKAVLKTESGEDYYQTRIGFRDAKFKRDGFYLNGKKIKLLGLNRHQTYPYVGPAMPKSAQVLDAKVIKEYGSNYVRTSHYPQSEDFLNACDELGLLVQDEIPGWQYTGKDKPWRDNFLHFISSMVDKEYNHPSLVLYGIRIDEGQDDDELYKEALKIVKEKDKVRQTTGVRNFKTSNPLEDVYSFNDFSHRWPDHGLDNPKSVKSARKGKKPYIVSEHNGHMFPTKADDNQAKRLQHAYNHMLVMEDFYKYEDIAALIGWCAFDYNTHSDFGSGDQVCYHGVFDIYRNPKIAAYAYQSQRDDKVVMQVAHELIPGDTDQALIKNIVLFTNVDYVKFYRGDSLIGTFNPDKKRFPHVTHPPIVLDNLIGELLVQEGLSKKDALKVGKVLSLAGAEGFTIKKRKVVPYIPVVLKNMITGKLSVKKIVDIFFKYMLVWGEKASEYKIEGYKNKQLVATQILGSPSVYHYEYDVSSDTIINADSYDVVKIDVKLIDNYNQVATYAKRAISISTTGPIEVIGPTLLPLTGGMISFYVRSKQIEAETIATVTIKTDLEEKEIKLIVK